MAEPVRNSGPDEGVALRAEDICMARGGHIILDHVNLTIRRGEVVVLLGSSGSGKTTLLRSLNLLNEPDSGRVSVEGTTIFDRGPDGRQGTRCTPRDLAQVRARMGMVFQHFNLFPHMTVLANIVEAPCRVQNIPRPQAEARARALLAQMGLERFSSVRPGRLSGGQQQRVGIARALAMEPSIMLLDEPTSALDTEMVGEVVSVIRTLARAGMTMVMVTHELGLALELADRVVILDQGKLIADGPPRTVLLHPTNARVQRFVGRFHASVEALRPLWEARRHDNPGTSPTAP
ncbi:amino acid ABC transporter ATP-binding protein [Gluconacetobacter takamatsuzukensis]|uniref:Amino acid ABC transporter ATP-binding protein n=1 Tax=Gluconacetobacter takamatsuzukensis TaxID=1286190 RepID=A0A7W4KG86_9PROT|nr:amino acid ABC transporter ATP-binding protein [Gluconacetobacter takamatsuzukensis]MBB2206386.1 amino acid ABC transporter ATP-binding protein [Gluconacetobacter takamatsuzukensis]